jgi:hypothetical protein
MRYCITPEVTTASLSINAGESGVNGLSLYQPGGSFTWGESFPLCGRQTARPVHGGQHPVSTSALRNARSRNEFNASSHPVGPALPAGPGRGFGVCFGSVLLLSSL